MALCAVLFTRRAQRQVTAAGQWWLENRPKAPEAFKEDLSKLISVLAQVPTLGALATNERLPGVRRVFIERIGYHLYYRYNESQSRITVIAFWHARRLPPSL